MCKSYEPTLQFEHRHHEQSATLRLEDHVTPVLLVHRFFLGTWNMKGFLSEERPIRTLREVMQRLRESYCGSIGYEVRTLAGHSVQSDAFTDSQGAYLAPDRFISMLVNRKHWGIFCNRDASNKQSAP